MDCYMTRGIYLRANGEINCYCSTGEQVSLAQLPVDRLDFDFMKDYYFNEKYQYLRDSVKNNRVPFPNQCLKCNYLRPNAEYPGDKKEIEWFHVEAASI
ncbi:MAG: hypothetical protein GY765_33075, partial [bacterium]|nr:hypothetical protein [bacterium]